MQSVRGRSSDDAHFVLNREHGQHDRRYGVLPTDAATRSSTDVGFRRCQQARPCLGEHLADGALCEAATTKPWWGSSGLHGAPLKKAEVHCLMWRPVKSSRDGKPPARHRSQRLS